MQQLLLDLRLQRVHHCARVGQGPHGQPAFAAERLLKVAQDLRAESAADLAHLVAERGDLLYVFVALEVLQHLRNRTQWRQYVMDYIILILQYR